MNRDLAEEYAIFIGMDPALKSDYGVAVHIVPLEPEARLSGAGQALPAQRKMGLPTKRRREQEGRVRR